MMRRHLGILAALLWACVACHVVEVDPSVRYPCPCLDGYVCGPDGYCAAVSSDGGVTGCADPTCEALGWECGVIDRCGEPVSCGECEHCGALDPGRCGGCREDAEDLPDPLFYDRNCDGIDGEVAAAVFLDPVGGSDTNDGRSMAAPVRTLGRALAVARGSNDVRQILIGEGTLSATGTYLVDRTVAIHGRYAPDAGWRRGPDVASTRIESGNVAMKQVGTNVRTLSGVVLVPNTPGANAGPARSSVGLIVEGNLRMWDVQVEASNGRDMPDAFTPPTTAVGGTGGAGGTPDGGPGGTSTCMAQGGAGGRGRASAALAPAAGQPSPGGAGGGSAGLASCTACGQCAGGEGAPGAPGGPGGDGAAVSDPGSWNSSELRYVDGEDGGLGAAGSGGGGGGGGGACTVMPLGGGGGGGGAGGCGGERGVGGQSGGHSIGVAVVNGTLWAEDVTIRLGRGGHGGAGTAGGNGGSGRPGGPGGPPGDSNLGSPGGKGGTGGPGGRGGHGGGGAGGWALGVWCANEGQLSSSPEGFDIQDGGPGEGGGSPGNAGPPGQRHAFYGCTGP